MTAPIPGDGCDVGGSAPARMTAQDICRAAKPGAADDWCEHVLWGRTPFPVGKVTPQSLYRAASALARAENKGHILCDFCEVVVPPGHYTCLACDAVLTSAQEQS